MQDSSQQTGTPDVIIIGAGLTGLTTAFYLKQQGKNILVIEKSDRTGGQIKTVRQKDYIFECGANTGTISHIEVIHLFDQLEKYCKLQTAQEAANNRLIWKKDRFIPLPSGLCGGLFTPLFSFGDKLRILGEPFRSKGIDPDESIASLVRRRLGNSYLKYAVDPFIAGVYAGDPEKLITRLALPKLYALEQQYGSFIKGAMAKAKIPKSEEEKKVTKKIFSTQGGMQCLTDALTQAIGADSFILGAQETNIIPQNDGFEVTFHTADGHRQNISTPKVIITTPAYVVPQLLPTADPSLLQAFRDLRYAPVVQVGIGIKKGGNRPLKAFGGLVPTIEKQPILGILFPSDCFEGRAPQGGETYSIFIGGTQNPTCHEMNDAQITDIADHAIHRMLHIPAHIEIDAMHISRHSKAIPQYEKTADAVLQAIDLLQKQHSGLIIAGNSRDGIGMADRIRQGTLLAKNI